MWAILLYFLSPYAIQKNDPSHKRCDPLFMCHNHLPAKFINRMKKERWCELWRDTSTSRIRSPVVQVKQQMPFGWKNRRAWKFPIKCVKEVYLMMIRLWWYSAVVCNVSNAPPKFIPFIFSGEFFYNPFYPNDVTTKWHVIVGLKR